MKKNSCTPINPKKYSCKEFDNEKKFLQLESSPPLPHNFSNGPSLNTVYILKNTRLSKRGGGKLKAEESYFV